MKDKKTGSALPLIIIIAAAAIFTALLLCVVRPVSVKAERLSELADGAAAVKVDAADESDNIALGSPFGGPGYTGYIVTAVNEDGSLRWEYEYDSSDRVVRYLGSEKLDTYAYNSEGNLVRHDCYTVEDGTVSEHPYDCDVRAYDSEGRLSAKYDLAYDAEADRMYAQETVLYEYDEHGNSVKETETNANGPVSTTVYTNTYDAEGRLTKRVTRQDCLDGDYTNATDTYKYDERGNVIETNSSYSAKSWDGISSYRDSEKTEYDAQGRVTVQMRYSNGALETTNRFTYWDNGNIKSKWVYNEKEDFARWKYSYDEDGNEIDEDITLEEELDSEGRVIRSTETDTTYSKPVVTTREYEYSSAGLLVRIKSVKDDRCFETVNTWYENYSYIYG